MNYVSNVTGSVSYALQSASQIAQSTDPATFAGWPEAVKARFVQANGTGTPPAVVVGSPGGPNPQVLATLSADGSSVTASVLPSDFGTAPADLSPASFESWSTDLQLFYLKNNLATGATTLDIGSGDDAIAAAISFDGDGVVVSGGSALDAAFEAELADPRYAPGAAASPTDFLSWPQDVQYRYFQKYKDGTGQLNFTGSSPAAAIPVQLSFNGVDYTVLARADQLSAAKATGFTTAPGVSADLFATWPRELQRAYVEAVADRTAQGGVAYPATVVLQGSQGTLIASVASRDTDVDATAAPSGFALPPAAAPSLETFTSWPEAAQLAYARAALTSAYRSLQLYSSSPAPQGTPSSLVVARDAASASGITLTPALGSAPQAADLGLLHLLSPVQLQTYLAQNGSGTPPAVVLGTSPSRFLVTAGTDIGQPAVAIQALPAAAALSPNQVASTTFLTWTAEVQNYYFGQHAIGTPAGLLLSDDALATVYTGPSNAGYSLQAVTAGFASATPASLSSATFGGWSPEAQAYYFALKATGTPPSLVLGDQTLVSRPADPTTGGLPRASLASLSAAPTAIDFLGWPPEVQSYYVAQHGTGTPKMLQLASSTQAGSGVLTATQDATNPYGLDLDIATGGMPTDADLPLLRLMTPAELQGYLSRHGSGSPKALSVGTTTLLTGSVDPSQAGAMLVPLPTATTALPAALSVDTFKTWSPEVQAYYVQQNATGTPPSVLVGTNPQALVTPSTDPKTSAVTLYPYPAAGLAASQVTGAAFSSWPAAVQGRFFALQATGTPPTLLLGPNGNRSLATAVGATGLAFTVQAYPSDPPSQVTADLFNSWSAEVQNAYAQQYGTGPLLGFVIGAATTGGRYLISKQADLTQTTLAGQVYDAALATAVASLPVSTFVGWTPEQRAYYLATKGTGTPPTVTFGTGFSVTATPTDPSGAYAIPYDNMYGGPSGTVATANVDTANALFPLYDGVTVLMTPKPTGFDTADPTQLDPTVFATWNSAIQLEYIHLHIGAASSLTIGNSTTGTNDVFIGGPKGPTGYGTIIYTAQNLQKQDIAKMSLADQTTLAGIASFIRPNTGLAAGLGLIPDGTVTDAATYVQSLITNATSFIGNPTGTYGAIAPLTVDGQMSAADRQVFLNEIANIGTELKTSAIFSPNDVNQQITTILTRYARANAFASSEIQQGTFTFNSIGAYEEDANHNSTVGNESKNTSDTGFFNDYWGTPDSISATIQKKYPNLFTKSATASNSSTSINTPIEIDHYDSNGNVDNRLFITNFSYSYTPAFVSATQNASYLQSYNLFMNQEKQILQLQNNGLSLASNGNVTGADGKLLTKNLDLPNLIYLFQLYANLTGEATIRADTEEISQANNLLKLYGIMQQIINATVATFTADDSKNGTAKGLATSPDPTIQAQWTEAERLFGTADLYVASPIEILKGIDRPRNNLTGQMNSTQWQQVGTQLSDKVTLLNQDSQLKMNDINSETKQKDRNFDLANSALSKMYDNLQKILGAS